MTCKLWWIFFTIALFQGLWQWFQVRLGAGAELVVAPKKRLVSTPSNDAKVSVENGKSDKAPVWTGHTWLRVQELDPSFMQPVYIGKLVCFSEPTTAMFVCPLTAKELRLTNGQLVALSELSVKGRSYNAQNGEREELFSTEAEGTELVDGKPKVKISGRRVVVRAVVTKLALQGHVMLAQTLQTYLGLNCHARKWCLLWAFFSYTRCHSASLHLDLVSLRAYMALIFRIVLSRNWYPFMRRSQCFNACFS